MIRNISLVAVVTLTLALSPFSSAQVIESGWGLTPQYDATTWSWQGSGSFSDNAQELQLRPYVPYPGQVGNPVTGSFQQPLQVPTTFGFGQSFESFPRPMSGSVLPLIEIPQSTTSSFQSASGLNQEIIISEEPVDGRIIGVVQADGSIVPIGQSGTVTQPMLPGSAQSEADAESVVGDNFGDPIMQPNAKPSIVLESDEDPSNEPGLLEIADSEPVPNVSPQKVVDARNEKANAQIERFEAYQIRMREMDREIAELIFLNETQSEEMQRSKAVLAEVLTKNEKRINASETTAHKMQKSMQRKLADLQHKNTRLAKKLESAKQKPEEPVQTKSEMSDLRRKLVNANREMVKLRRSLEDAEMSVERLKKRNSRPSTAAAKLKAELAALKLEMVAREKAAKATEKKLSDFGKDDSAKVSKLKNDLAKAKRAADEMESKFAEVKKAKSKPSDDKKKFDALKESHSKASAEHKACEKRIKEMAKKLETMEKKHATAIAELDKEYKSSAETQRNALTELEAAKSELAEQKQMNAQLKADFMKAFEADKKTKAKDGNKPQTEAEVRKASIMKRREAEKAEEAKESKKSDETDKSEKSKKTSKSKKNTDSKKNADSKKETDTKEAKLLKRQEKLRDEMKEKMDEAKDRIRAVGKKKIDALLKRGKKEDSDEIKAEKERTEDSVKISDRKIRARYERKIKRLK